MGTVNPRGVMLVPAPLPLPGVWRRGRWGLLASVLLVASLVIVYYHPDHGDAADIATRQRYPVTAPPLLPPPLRDGYTIVVNTFRRNVCLKQALDHWMGCAPAAIVVVWPDPEVIDHVPPDPAPSVPRARILGVAPLPSGPPMPAPNNDSASNIITLLPAATLFMTPGRTRRRISPQTTPPIV